MFFSCCNGQNIGGRCRKMSMAFILIKRNIKLFFKDKGMFFTSLITPCYIASYFM